MKDIEKIEFDALMRMCSEAFFTMGHYLTEPYQVTGLTMGSRQESIKRVSKLLPFAIEKFEHAKKIIDDYEADRQKYLKDNGLKDMSGMT